MTRRLKITGKRGQWTAEVEGRELPVLHSTYLGRDGAYHAPIRAEDHGRKLDCLLAALSRENLVVLQRDKGPELHRDGYVGVFAFSGLSISESDLRLTLTAKYAEPAS